VFLLAVLVVSTYNSTAIDACDVESLETFKAVFIGDSLTGGAGVGGKNTEADKCADNPVPWPETLPSTNPGDVPGKVKQISDAACQFNFQWSQNTRSAHFLSTQAGSCKLVNENMITEMGADLNVLVVQAQSEELAKDTCEPDSDQVTNLNILLDLAPSNSKKMLFATWAGYDADDEIRTFEKLNCTQQDLKGQLSMQILPVGQSFEYIADSNNCDNKTYGYVSYSCSLWSNSGDGLFADSIHPSETSGAWLAALVVYGGMQTPVCLPPPELLAPSGLSYDVKTELATAAAVALTEEHGSSLFECFSGSAPSASPSEGVGVLPTSSTMSISRWGTLVAVVLTIIFVTGKE
jgi:hypothetical protein